jgi:hypothetical protein
MTDLPGHYLGSIVTYAANTPWNLEYSIALDRDGHYQLFTRDKEGRVRMRHAGTSGRALAEFAVQNGFDARELLCDLGHIDAGFAADFEAFLAQRARR